MVFIATTYRHYVWINSRDTKCKYASPRKYAEHKSTINEFETLSNPIGIKIAHQQYRQRAYNNIKFQQKKNYKHFPINWLI